MTLTSSLVASTPFSSSRVLDELKGLSAFMGYRDACVEQKVFDKPKVFWNNQTFFFIH